jgi:hypothetical protein
MPEPDAQRRAVVADEPAGSESELSPGQERLVAVQHRGVAGASDQPSGTGRVKRGIGPRQERAVQRLAGAVGRASGGGKQVRRASAASAAAKERGHERLVPRSVRDQPRFNLNLRLGDLY